MGAQGREDGRETDEPLDARTEEADGRDAALPVDDPIDEAERESFPASDPPSTWAGADRPPER